jgi:hypothetical protein
VYNCAISGNSKCNKETNEHGLQMLITVCV